MIHPPPPQIEIIHCLQQEQDMADDKDKKDETAPVERCVPKPKDGENRTADDSGGGGDGKDPPKVDD